MNIPCNSKLATTHGTGDKAFDWKVLLSENIWRLQVQSLQQVRITKDTTTTTTTTTTNNNNNNQNARRKENLQILGNIGSGHH